MEPKLTQEGDCVCLNVVSDEPIRIKLQWKRPSTMWRLLNGYVDLDLGCFYELENGDKKLIDCLQFSEGNGGEKHECTHQGCYVAPPFIWHTGDAKGLEEEPTEELLINPAGIEHINKIMIYAYVYEGPSRWGELAPQLRVCVDGSDDIIVPIKPQKGKRFMALASIAMDSARQIAVTPLGTSHDGHADCDSAYGWGFKYREN